MSSRIYQSSSFAQPYHHLRQRQSQPIFRKSRPAVTMPVLSFNRCTETTFQERGILMTLSRRVLDVGNCGPDHRSITMMIQHAFPGVIVDQADDTASALEKMGSHPYLLVLVNRKLDCDYSDGIEVIRAIKSDPLHSKTPVMLVTNYPEHQQQAIAVGAIEGFGKLQLQLPETKQRLAAVLCSQHPHPAAPPS